MTIWQEAFLCLPPSSHSQSILTGASTLWLLVLSSSVGNNCVRTGPHLLHVICPVVFGGLPQWLCGKEFTCNTGNVGDIDSIPGLGRSFEGGNDNSLQYSCPKTPMDSRAWWAIVQKVAKSWTQPSNWTHTHSIWWSSLSSAENR